MGISFKIDSDEGVVYSIAEGIIRAEDIWSYRKNLQADPKYHTGLCEIVECRLSRFSISDEESKALASDRPADHTRKVAIVGDGPIMRLASRYKELSVDKPVEVFSDLGSARKWVISD